MGKFLISCSLPSFSLLIVTPERLQGDKRHVQDGKGKFPFPALHFQGPKAPLQLVPPNTSHWRNVHCTSRAHSSDWAQGESTEPIKELKQI